MFWGLLFARDELFLCNPGLKENFANDWFYYVYFNLATYFVLLYIFLNYFWHEHVLRFEFRFAGFHFISFRKNETQKPSSDDCI